METKIYTFERLDVSNYVHKGRTEWVGTLEEDRDLTKYRGYFYELFNVKGNSIGYGIPK